MTQIKYCRLSNLAVIACGIAVLSLFGLLTPEGIILAIPAIPCALIALHEIRKYHLAGRRLALTGLFTSVAAVTLIPFWHYANYLAEALPGYHRANFAALVKDDQMDALDGKQICLKGFRVWESSAREWNGALMMSPDGDHDRPQSAVLVEPPMDEEPKFAFEPLAVSGTLQRNPAWVVGGKAPKFMLRNAVIRRSRTPFDILFRANNGC